jgi:hypothetical protein
MAREIAGLGSARERLFAMLRAYIDHGVENPALYGLMFGGHLSGPDYSRPAIELAEAEKTKALLVGVIVEGGLGHPIPDKASNERKIAGAILACWSLVHGLTLLLADGLVGPKNKSGALGDSLVQGMLNGLEAELPTLPPGTWVGPQVPQSSRPIASKSSPPTLSISLSGRQQGGKSWATRLRRRVHRIRKVVRLYRSQQNITEPTQRKNEDHAADCKQCREFAARRSRC